MHLPHRLNAFIWHYLRHQKRYLIGYILIAMCVAVEISLGPYLLKLMIDSVSSNTKDYPRLITVLWPPACAYVILSIVMNFNFRFYDYLSLRMFPELRSAIYKEMFAYALHHSYAFFQTTYTGLLTQKITDMTENVQTLVLLPLAAFGPQFLTTLVSSFMLMVVVHPLFGYILLVWVVFFVLVSFGTSRMVAHFSKNRAESRTKISAVLSDVFANVMSTKLFDTVEYECEHLNQDIHQFVTYDRRARWFALKINFMQKASVTILMVAMLLALLYGLPRGWVTAGDFALVMALIISLTDVLLGLSFQIQNYVETIGTCRQALSFISQPHEITDVPDALSLEVFHGQIKFDQVCFNYEQGGPLFDQLTVTINPGEKVGLVGYSGSGKSTFFKLILRLLEPQSGLIFIDEQDIKAVTKSSLIKHMGAIQQEPEIFHRSVFDNIRYGKINATEEEVVAAAKKARCHEFIMDLPQQYHSLLGDRGIKLSSGQKQRISIARAFLKNAPILLLDEATSALDSMNEALIQEALGDVMRNKTTLVIAHRLATIKNLDRILVFVDGQIVEDGTVKQLLLNKQGHFYKLWHLQVDGFIA